MKTLALALVVTLSACAGGDLSDRPHDVADYYADAQLSTDTMEACRASTEAEYQVMQAKTACQNVQLAEQQRDREAQAESETEWNRAMEQLLRERATARNAASLASG